MNLKHDIANNKVTNTHDTNLCNWIQTKHMSPKVEIY